MNIRKKSAMPAIIVSMMIVSSTLSLAATQGPNLAAAQSPPPPSSSSPDLFAFKKSNTQTNSTEVYVVSGTNPQQLLLQTGTALPETDETYEFAVDDWNHDGTADVVAIKMSNTGTNSTELQILDGASNFTSFLVQTGTALPETDETYDFGFDDWNSDGTSDLVAIKMSNTETNSTEIQVLNGASNFTAFLVQTGTALPQAGEEFDFAVDDWNNDGTADVVAIKMSNTGTNSTEIQVVSGANPQEFLVQTGTVLPQADEEFDFAADDWNSDGTSDLVAIKIGDTDTNSTELDIVSGASPLEFLVQTGTALPETDDTYDFDTWKAQQQ
ncbi:FG-GAP-like repeat-containing protein [Nitrososphaera viennensis]|nr:FG-GAP-like repeat-containing protein [Nitrososphaera viennensis]